MKEILQTSDSETQDLFDKLDSDGSGNIEFSEFVTFVFDKNLMLSEYNLKTSFDALKGEKDYIDKEELQNMFGLSREDHESKNDPIWNELIAEADKDLNNQIDFDEFQQIMQSFI